MSEVCDLAYVLWLDQIEQRQRLLFMARVDPKQVPDVRGQLDAFLVEEPQPLEAADLERLEELAALGVL